MGRDLSSTHLLKDATETSKTYGLSALLSFGILLIVPKFVDYIVIYYIGGILFLMSILAPVVVKFIPKERISPEGKAIFITGCDRGFGYMLAQRMDDLGFVVFAGCLLPEGDGATNLRVSGSQRTHVIGLDVTNDASVHKAADYVRENLKNNVLWAVVNNAGITGVGELQWTSMETIQRIVEVNTLGVVRVTKAFLPSLKESQGRVMTVASLAGRYTTPLLVPYCISKAAAIGFSDGLRQEMHKWNIQVITVEPSFYRTDMISAETIDKFVSETWEKAPSDVKETFSSNYPESFQKRIYQLVKTFSKDPQEVISVMEDGLTALCPEYSYTLGNSVTRFGTWLLPKLPKSFADMLVFCILNEVDI